jgi:hypothetical protein
MNTGSQGRIRGLRWFAAIGLTLLPAACNNGSTLRSGVEAGVEADVNAASRDSRPAPATDAVSPNATAVDAYFLAGAVCPVGVAVLDICGCGCCGGQPGATYCYYPAVGQTREAIPNPIPPSCAAAGCAFGGRHLCCADPGETASNAMYCARDSSSEDYPSFTVNRQDGDTCTEVVFSLTSSVSKTRFRLSSSWGGFDSAWRGPCDGSGSRSRAIGGLGTVVREDGADGLTHLGMHFALFFDGGAGAADSVRFDVDDVVLGNCPADGGTP